MKKKKKEEYEESPYLYKTFCPRAGCGSSDANAVYANGNTHCFSCGGTTFANKDHAVKENEDTTDEVGELETWVPDMAAAREADGSLLTPEIRALDARKINLETVRKFNYGYANGKQVATYCDAEGNPVAQKLRDKDKNFSWVGSPKKAGLFGQQLWTPHPKKRIVVTEGEIDCLSVSQVQENKWAVVSVPNGAASAARDIRKHLEWLSGFKEVVICFDNDEAGQKAAKEVAALLPPNKALIATFPLKDANEMLKAGRGAEIITCLWDAKKYAPDGVLFGRDLLNKLGEVAEEKSYAYPEWLPALNKKTLGIRIGELDVFTSGTGSGKTTLIKQFELHFKKTTPFNQALIHLEEPLQDSVNSLVGLDLKKRLHMGSPVDKDIIKAKQEELVMEQDNEGFYRFNFYDAFGSVEEEKLYNMIRFMVNGLGCKIIWLDHLSILVSSLSQDSDERRTIDSIMHNLKSLTVELKCYIGLIVHLNNDTKGQGKTFEEGAIPHLNNLRGSGGIKQLANSVIAFSRNQQAEDDLERNSSLITVLKCRYTGDTGKADWVFYDRDTGCLGAGVDPKSAQFTKPDEPSEFEETAAKNKDF